MNDMMMLMLVCEKEMLSKLRLHLLFCSCIWSTKAIPAESAAEARLGDLARGCTDHVEALDLLPSEYCTILTYYTILYYTILYCIIIF